MEQETTQKPPKNWLILSIISTLFCCLPFGIAGIVNASKVESRFYAGDIQGATRASSQAKKWTIIAIVSGIIFFIIYIILFTVGLFNLTEGFKLLDQLQDVNLDGL